jgi:hypothetical protein
LALKPTCRSNDRICQFDPEPTFANSPVDDRERTNDAAETSDVGS